MKVIDIIDVLSCPVVIKTFMDSRVLFEGFACSVPEDLFDRRIHVVYPDDDCIIIEVR